MVKRLSYSKQWISEEDIQAVIRVLKSKRITQGEEIRFFERDICKYTGAKFCTCVSNGTAALYLAARALGVKEGDLVLTTPITFCATANAFALCGARIDFIDIDPETLQISPSQIELYIKQTGSVPTVVIPVDFYGISADLVKIHRLSRDYNFKVVEDAAHSIGSSYSYNGEDIFCGACRHSDLSIFSFHPVKNITSAEGGAVLTNDETLFRCISLLANHGIERDPNNFEFFSKDQIWPYELHELSLNFRLSDIHAALGRSQLSRIDLFKRRKQRLFRAYRERLFELEEKEILKLPIWPKGQDPCFHLFIIRLGTKSPINRDELFKGLTKYGIYPQVHYWPLHLHPYYRKVYGYKEGKCPIAEEFAKTCLSLPFFASMEIEDVNFVCATLKKLLLS